VDRTLIGGEVIEDLALYQPGRREADRTGSGYPLLRQPGTDRLPRFRAELLHRYRRLHRPGRLLGPGQGPDPDDLRGSDRRGQAFGITGAGRRRFSHRHQMGILPQGPGRPENTSCAMPTKETRGLYGPGPPGRKPPPGHRGHDPRGLRHRAAEGYLYVRYEYPMATKNALWAIQQAKELGLLGPNILGTAFRWSCS